MVDPVATSLVNVGLALTSMLLNATQQQQAAAIVTDARDPIILLTQAILGRRGTKKDIERTIHKDLTLRMREMSERCHSDGINSDRLASPCAEVEEILNAIDDHEQLLEQAVHDPNAVRAFFEQQAQNSRIQVDERLVPYFDELITAVTELYITYAERSSNYQQLALKQLLKSDRENRETWAQMHETIVDVPHKVAELVSSESKPSRVFFGSRPNVVTENRFVERSEQEQLNALITNPTKQPTVLVGMRGCGKTQLAAALAEQCEDAHWSLVAWVNASSTESITSDLVELARELKIDTSGQPTAEAIIHRLFTRLKSAVPSDRLIVFDNVEDINDICGLVPTGDGLRVVATTTNDNGWNFQWDTVRIGVFDREKSIDYLLTVTNSTDHDAADTLARRLGDLPLALAQAAATALNEDWTLTQYLRLLEKYRSEQVIRSIPGDEYPHDVYGALRMAIRGTLNNLDEGTRRAARRQLGALALLAESGVPTHWLDPMSEEPNDAEFQDHDRAADEDAHKALTKLIRRSIVQQSADKATTMLHRLQARAFRESWSKEEREQACESAATLLGSVNIDSFDRTDTESRLRETRSLIEQIRAISEQRHSKSLFKYEQIALILSHTLSHARDLGILYEALALEEPVLATLNMAQQLDEIAALNLKEQLAYTYMYAEQFDKAFNLYAQVIDDRTAIQGHDHRDTLASRNNLAYAYYWEGDTGKAIDLFEQVLDDRTRIQSSDHEDTLMTGSYLALAYADDGQLERAIALGEQVVKDRDSVLKPDHKHTLVTRNNLADAYKSVGRLTDAIKMYEYVLEARIRTLGNTHHHTRITRNDLAQTYEQAGDLPKAISMYEDLHNDYIQIYGADHESTIEVRDRLEAAKQKLEQQENATPAE
ncbi:tetratricopeptide repeat protein [Actinomyces bouchesdurhonensis]|uniref:tetratricopeptide repeat protein n=1 Tax=Actinomyces bouchesdurhonensis TaxID=1852361 RepID=UPI000A01CFFC|nr:tetratricopeptide repeat protein [Actinomyces bouchesdurhonensis]